jgi:thioesterase domain-containing protein
VSAASFLSELRRRDIQVWLDGGQLRCSAKSGALTPELREELALRKQEIVKVLSAAQALVSQERAIVPLQASGSRIPVFAVPGHNGDVFCYRALAQRLGEDQPFFGLQPPGVDGLETPLGQVEELAACFARQIRAFRPQGPYVIAGFCAGGTVAFELAQRLAREGATISLLALFGSPYPAYFKRASQLAQQLAQQAARFATLTRELLSRSPRECRSYLKERLARRRERLAAARAAAADPLLQVRAKVERATVAAVAAYVPTEYKGRTVLFLPNRQWDVADRWRSVAPRAERYFGPDGVAQQVMLREPNAGTFAELFRAALQDWKIP